MQSINESNISTSEDRFTVHDVPLIVLTASSGAVDAISYFGLGKIFWAFMTENIVFLGFDRTPRQTRLIAGHSSLP